MWVFGDVGWNYGIIGEYVEEEIDNWYVKGVVTNFGY